MWLLLLLSIRVVVPVVWYLVPYHRYTMVGRTTTGIILPGLGTWGTIDIILSRLSIPVLYYTSTVYILILIQNTCIRCHPKMMMRCSVASNSLPTPTLSFAASACMVFSRIWNSLSHFLSLFFYAGDCRSRHVVCWFLLKKLPVMPWSFRLATCLIVVVHAPLSALVLHFTSLASSCTTLVKFTSLFLFLPRFFTAWQKQWEVALTSPWSSCGWKNMI